MTITYNNYPEQKSKIDFSKLPKTVTDIVPNISALDDYHELYNDDETIAKAFDFVLEKINAANFVKDHIVFAKMPTRSPVAPFTPGQGSKMAEYLEQVFKYLDDEHGISRGDAQGIIMMPGYKKLIQDNFEGKLNPADTAEQIVRKSTASDDKPSSHVYKLGDKYRSDFDDEGMMKMGLQTTVKWGSKKLEKLFESFQDNNYHTVAAPLWGAITLLKKAEKAEDTAKEAAYLYDAEDLLKDFHSLIKDLGITDDKPSAKVDTKKPVKFFVKGQWVDFSNVELDWDHPINILDRKSGQFKQALEEYVNEHPELLKPSKKSGKVKLKSIKISGTEGYDAITEKIQKVEYKTWESANNALKQLMIQDGEEIGGYKSNATVTFEDGETYQARMYLSKNEDDPFATSNVVGKHILEFMNWMINNEKSTESEKSKAKMQLFLDTYDLGIIKDIAPVYELKATSKSSTPKTSKPKREPKVKLEKTKDMRAVIPEDVKLLRRVKNLIGKRKPKKDFINTHKAIELADTERRITKTSQYADELNYSLEWIEKCVNYMVEQGEESGQFKLKDEAMQAAIVEAADGYAIMEAVAILKQYIKLQGRTESRVAAQKLYDRLVKYETNGPKAAHYSSKLSEVKSELQNFLNHKKTSLNLSATALSGITQGLGCNCTLSEIGYVAKPTNTDYDLPIPRKKNDGFSGFGNINPLPGAASDDFNFEAANYVVEDDEDTDPKVDINPYDGGVPMNQVKVNTNTFKLPGDIGKFIGPIALDRYAMILKGDPGAGKSRLSLMIANAFLAKFPRVDYFSFEMSPNNPVIKADYFDKYIQPDRAGRLITHSEGTIEKVRRVAGKSRVVIIDSWGKLGCRIEEYGNLRKTFPGTAFIVIFQSTVDGKARGGSSSAFDCDELVHIHTSEGDYKKTFAQKQKTRYGTPDLQFNLFEQKLM